MLVKLSLKKTGYNYRGIFHWGKRGNTVLCFWIESLKEMIPQCYYHLSLDVGIMGDFNVHYYIFIWYKISAVDMLFNEGMGSVVGNWSKSLLALIYKYLSPQLYITCAFFELLISHGRSNRHWLPFPALISLALQVTHSCHIIAGSLEINVLRCRSGNWDPEDFTKEWFLLSWVTGRWSSWFSTLSLVPCCIHEDVPKKRKGFLYV